MEEEAVFYLSPAKSSEDESIEREERPILQPTKKRPEQNPRHFTPWKSG